MDIKLQNGGDGSLNIQGDSIQINLIKKEVTFSSIFFDAELSKINDRLYSGRPKQWDATVDRVKNILGVDSLKPAVLLNLASTCAIGRIRQEIDSSLPLLFTDTSWITHSTSFWNEDPQMQRWLHALGEVAIERAGKNLKTYRVFFWDPKAIEYHQQILEISKTIHSHLSYGISVVMLDIQAGYSPIDVHVYTISDGLYSNEFSIFNIRELKDRDTISEYLKYIPGFCEEFPNDGSAIFFSTIDNLNNIVKSIGEHCQNIKTG